MGDDDQSIYGFRGAKPSYIRNFVDHFEGGQIIPIPDCFRCQPHVIRAAHGFIEELNPDRIKKPDPKCTRPQGPPVFVHDAPSDNRESTIIATMAAAALREGDVLVLLPRPDYAEPLKIEFRKRRIAFDAPVRRKNYSTLIFSALRDWLSDPSNNLAFRELLMAIADGEALGIPGPRARKAEKVAERQEALIKISNLWTHVFARTTLREALRASAPKDDLYEVLDGLADHLAQATTESPTELAQHTFAALRPWPNSNSMLDELATSDIDSQGPRDGDANLVRIMTMRNSKGLEADFVIVIGLEEGAFPGDDHVDEDARMFYVSMTRAKNELHLFHARKRSGGMTHKAQSFSLKPSPFLGRLPKAHCERKYHQSVAKRAVKR